MTQKKKKKIKQGDRLKKPLKSKMKIGYPYEVEPS